MRTLFYVLPIIIVMSACQTSDFEGFDRISNSLHVKRSFLGDDKVPVTSNAYLSLQLNLFNTYDSLVAVKTYENIHLGKTALPAYMTDLLQKSFEGDSLSFMGLVKDIELNKLFQQVKLPALDTIRLELKLKKVLTDVEIRKQRAEKRVLEDLEIQERAKMAQVLDSLGMSEQHALNGIYVKILKVGNGKRPKAGESIRVNYISHTAAGRLIDNTFKAKALEYEIGKPDQVLEGFEIGISSITEGAKAIFVIPSQLAFGEKGSSSGIVGPFETVIFEIKLEKVGV